MAGEGPQEVGEGARQPAAQRAVARRRGRRHRLFRQPGGGGEAVHGTAPERLVDRLVTLLQPGDVVAVGAAGRQARRLAQALAPVELEQLAEQQRHRPAVEQDVVIGPHHLHGVLEAEQRQAQQRRAAEVEAAAPVGLQPGGEVGLPRRRIEMAAVLLVPAQLDRAFGPLHRPLAPLPEEGAAQDRMAGEHRAPSPAEGGAVEAG